MFGILLLVKLTVARRSKNEKVICADPVFVAHNSHPARLHSFD
jgi:hypothetical protein